MSPQPGNVLGLRWQGGSRDTVFVRVKNYLHPKIFRPCEKAAVNAPPSKRCRDEPALTDCAERLDCGGFSTAFGRARGNLHPRIFQAGERGGFSLHIE